MQSICSDGPCDDSGTGSSYITRRRSEPGLSGALESSALRFLGGGVLRIILHGFLGFLSIKSLFLSLKAPDCEKNVRIQNSGAIFVFRSFWVYACPNTQFRIGICILVFPNIWDGGPHIRSFIT